VDALITTNAVADEYMTNISRQLSAAVVFSIAWWKEDRRACFHNDIGRRERSSSVSIKSLRMEVPSPELASKHRATLEEHTVVFKPIESASWCLGGSSSDCYGNDFVIDAEQQPEFVELDKFLELAAPTLSYLQYRRLYRECVQVVEFTERDYYGSSENAKYVCDTDKALKLIVEIGLPDVYDPSVLTEKN
jgi:hypothetical protein